jgi:hypothetical protein
MSVGTREIIMKQRDTIGQLEEKANNVMNKVIDGKLLCVGDERCMDGSQLYSNGGLVSGMLSETEKERLPTT